jgi:hypothetical protein
MLNSGAEPEIELFALAQPLAIKGQQLVTRGETGLLPGAMSLNPTNLHLPLHSLQKQTGMGAAGMFRDKPHARLP